MPITEILSSGIIITNTRAEHAAALETLQRIVFPELAEEELFHEDQYIAHLNVFPEGQLVVLDNEKVIGATTCMRYHLNMQHMEHHTFYEMMGGGWLTTHEPNGAWLYGLDVSVHPDYRGKGIAKTLYKVRQDICIELGLKGQMTVGMLNGYYKVKDEMSIEAYYEKVRSGELFDPTVSVQKKIGFTIAGLMKEYLNDPTCGNAGAVIIMEVKT